MNYVHDFKNSYDFLTFLLIADLVLVVRQSLVSASEENFVILLMHKIVHTPILYVRVACI